MSASPAERRRGLPAGGAPFAVLLLHALALGAALTQLAKEVFGPFDGGIAVAEFGPATGGTGRAAAVAVAYAVAIVALALRAPGAWAYSLVLTLVIARIAIADGVVPVLMPVIAVLLALRSTRAAFVRER